MQLFLDKRTWRRWLIFVLALLGVLAAGACSGENGAPDVLAPDALTYVTHAEPALGVTLDYPANWVVHNDVGALTVASDAAVITADSLSTIGDAAFVFILPGELDVFNFQTGQTLAPTEAARALGAYKSLLEREGQAFTELEPPQPLAAGEQPGAVTVLRSELDGAQLVTLLGVIINEGQVALISAVSHADTAVAYRPIFNRILSSVRVSVPK